MRGREGGPRTFKQADGRVIEYTQISFSPAERPDYKLVLLVPRG